MLVVADEVFTMADRPLSQIVRVSVPNTLKESTLVGANPANNQDSNWMHRATGLHPKMGEREINRNDNNNANDEMMNYSIQRSEMAR